MRLMCEKRETEKNVNIWDISNIKKVHKINYNSEMVNRYIYNLMHNIRSISMNDDQRKRSYFICHRVISKLVKIENWLIFRGPGIGLKYKKGYNSLTEFKIIRNYKWNKCKCTTKL